MNNLKIYLTFDEPYGSAPPGVLSLQQMKEMERERMVVELLDKYNITSTFFVTGRTAEKFPWLIKELARRHEIACHGYKHEVMTKLSYENQARVIQKTRAIIKNVTGRAPVGWRSPFFKSNYDTYVALVRNGFKYVSDGNVNILHPFVAFFMYPLINNLTNFIFKSLSRSLLSFGYQRMYSMIPLFKLPPNMMPMIFEIRIQNYPYLLEIGSFGADDSYLYQDCGMSPNQVIEVWKKTLDIAEKWNAGMCVLCMHPWVEVNPQRYDALKSFIEYLVSLKGVEFFRLESLFKEIAGVGDST